MEYLMFLIFMLMICILLMAFALTCPPKAEDTPGMDKQEERSKLEDSMSDKNKIDGIVYVACEIKMSYDTEVVGVFDTLEEAEKYCEYKGIVGGDSFFYATAHGINEKKIPREIGVEIIESRSETIVNFFDSEKSIKWGKDDSNENVIRLKLVYNGEPVEELKEMAIKAKGMITKWAKNI